MIGTFDLLERKKKGCFHSKTKHQEKESSIVQKLQLLYYLYLYRTFIESESHVRGGGCDDDTKKPERKRLDLLFAMTTPFVKSKHDYGPQGFRWISAKRIEWVGADGRTRFWESVERTTRPVHNGGSGADAVALVAKTRGEDSQILLIKQFRPPLGKYCLEMPAGLVDEGETVEAAALRELKEETGYTGNIVSMSPIVFNDPGITNANMMLCICDIDLDVDVNKNVTQDCHDGEFLTVEWAPHQDLLEYLLQKRDDTTEIDARLLMYAMGFHQARILSESATTPRVEEAEAEEAEPHPSHGNLLRHSPATLHFREVVAWAVTGIALLVSIMRR